MDIRRTLLWMVFSFSLLLLWNNWQVYHGRPSLFGGAAVTAPDGAPTGQAGSSQTLVGDASIPSAPAQATPNLTPSVAATPAGAAGATSGETVVITTDTLRLSFDASGAQLVHAELRKLPATEDRTQPTVLLERSAGSTYVVQTGVIGAPAGSAYPTHQTPFTLVSQERELRGDSLDVVFEAQAGELKVVKTFTVRRDDYRITVTHQVVNQSAAPVNPALYLQITRDGNSPSGGSSFYNTFTGPAVYSEQEKFQKVSFSDLDKNKASYVRTSDNGWIAMIQHYFVTAWVPQPGKPRTNEIVQIQPNLYAARVIESVGEIAPGAAATVTADLWVGPQDQNALEALAPGLNLVVDYGWLTLIAKPLFGLMTWLHALLGNWGWTIVALTVLIKAAFYPLASTSYRSMARMKQVAPRLQALKEKYGDDRAKLNAAMMTMYRTEKINPLGGCLPILVQIPVFISLYWVLLASVEMRGAPWLLWIEDLSVRDPWFILPAIMMVTMFLQIKLNPTPPDPMQARIMMIMPLVFGGMMFFFPAGLVLYWCVNNILSIAQQWTITKKLERETARAANS